MVKRYSTKRDLITELYIEREPNMTMMGFMGWMLDHPCFHILYEYWFCGQCKKNHHPDVIGKEPEDMVLCQARDWYELVPEVKEPVSGIQQLDLYDNVIQVFKDIAEATKVTGIEGKGIRDNLRGRQKTSKGFKWIQL